MAMRHPIRTLLAGAALLYAGSAAADLHDIFGDMEGLRGSGVIKTETRQVEPFEVIESKGSIDLDIHIGPQLSVAVEADDNLLDLVRTEVSGGVLEVDSRKGNWSSHHNIVVHVTLPQLSALGISGSGDAKLSGMNGGKLGVKIVGSGDLSASGRVDELHLVIKGSGDAKLEQLAADAVLVRIDGSGDATVNAAKSIDATIHGSGDVRWHGTATDVDSQIYGSGEMVHK
jgi:hypothetical protein